MNQESTREEKLKMLDSLKKLVDLADNPTEELMQNFVQQTLDIITPQEVYTMTAEQKKQQNCEAFLRRVQQEIAGCQNNYLEVCTFCKPHADYAMSKLEKLGYTVYWNDNTLKITLYE